MAKAEEGDVGPHLKGSVLPATVEMIVNEVLVVSVTLGARTFSGVLMDVAKRVGPCEGYDALFPKGEQRPSELILLPQPQASAQPPDSPGADAAQPKEAPEMEQTHLQDSVVKHGQPHAFNLPSSLPWCPTANAVGNGVLLYHESHPLPSPLMLRQSYGQFLVPQPPPRRIKRVKRRTARNDPSKLIVSSITLRPRRVLCEKCKSCITSEKPSGGHGTSKSKADSGRRNSAPCDLIVDDKLRKRRPEDLDPTVKRMRRDCKADNDGFESDVVHRSPVIKISYNTPQGKGEVVKIPSKVHSANTFGHKKGQQQQQNGKGSPNEGEKWRPTTPTTSDVPAAIPKLRITRPTHHRHPANAALTTPKIRLRPRGPKNGDSVAVYTAELVGDRAAVTDSPPSEVDSLVRSKSDSVCGEESDGGRFIHLRIKRRSAATESDRETSSRIGASDLSEDSASGNESENESHSASHSDGGSSDEFPPEGVMVGHGEREGGRQQRAVPPLTVRVRTADSAITECFTPDGRKVHVGDVVWAKIHGFPWWPACVLGLSPELGPGGQQESGEALVSWFGSHTTSAVSLAKLAPFQDSFRARLDRKRKGRYRQAVAEAARATKRLTAEVKAWLAQYKT
ncbi:PWWP domain-containing protein 2B [Lethenteron reissneri]|uniref:PWWP domain-containing protein 2B n=1 Tax=Lethenteron reissneri TaxID=7753 RepID=UPI002AB7B94F|nr:PWWP domain-containing protein 2B [Lethenteron reissneri]